MHLFGYTRVSFGLEVVRWRLRAFFVTYPIQRYPGPDGRCGEAAESRQTPPLPVVDLHNGADGSASALLSPSLSQVGRPWRLVDLL